jgi:hypothetical protein
MRVLAVAERRQLTFLFRVGLRRRVPSRFEMPPDFLGKSWIRDPGKPIEISNCLCIEGTPTHDSQPRIIPRSPYVQFCCLIARIG